MKSLLSTMTALAAMAAIVMGFQNCSSERPAALDGTVSSNGTESSSPKVAVTDSTQGSGNGNNVQISSYVFPVSIQFVPASNDPVNDTFLYTLNVNTGAVQNSSGDVVYTATSTELSQLFSILDGSVYGSQAEVYELAGQTPPPECETVAGDYAILNTTGGSYDLNGVCGGTDLYNPSTLSSAGLESFLSNLQTEAEQGGGIGIIGNGGGSGNGNGNSSVQFSATPLSGNASLLVTFTASGLSADNKYNLVFGDGTSQELTLALPDCAIGASPCLAGGHASHTYSAAGTYTATLYQTPNYVCAGVAGVEWPNNNCPFDAPVISVGTVTITVTTGDAQPLANGSGPVGKSIL